MKNNEQSAVKKEITITLNKKAYYEYEILQKYEGGIVLLGTEIKALRVHKANIGDAYARMKNGEVWLVNSNIPVYKFGNINNHNPMRERKLLFHKSEIKKIDSKLKDKGLTLIPLKMYFLGSKAKIELGIAKGKKSYDKRESIKKADMKRQLSRVKI
jgi:SsrA-binding protein